MEFILITSRDFDKKPKLSTLRRVMRFISEEVGYPNKANKNVLYLFLKLFKRKLILANQS